MADDKKNVASHIMTNMLKCNLKKWVIFLFLSTMMVHKCVYRGITEGFASSVGVGEEGKRFT